MHTYIHTYIDTYIYVCMALPARDRRAATRNDIEGSAMAILADLGRHYFSKNVDDFFVLQSKGSKKRHFIAEQTKLILFQTAEPILQTYSGSVSHLSRHKIED